MVSDVVVLPNPTAMLELVTSEPIIMETQRQQGIHRDLALSFEMKRGYRKYTFRSSLAKCTSVVALVTGEGN